MPVIEQTPEARREICRWVDQEHASQRAAGIASWLIDAEITVALRHKIPLSIVKAATRHDPRSAR